MRLNPNQIDLESYWYSSKIKINKLEGDKIILTWIFESINEVKKTIDKLKKKQKLTEASIIHEILTNHSRVINDLKILLKNYDIQTVEKDDKKAQSLREKGNSFYYDKKYEQSHFYFSLSILYSTCESVEKALAYANRSAVYFHLKEYRNCIFDCESCLKKYPNDKISKIYYRLANCYNELDEPEKSLETMKLCINSYVSSVKPVPENVLKLQKKILEMIKFKQDIFSQIPSKFKKDEEILPKKDDEIPPKSEPELAYGRNATFANASSAISLKYSKHFGRYVIANRDIKYGDILFVEEPYVCIINEPTFDIYRCKNCFENLHFRFFCCTNCIEFVYCSEKCRLDHWNKYHQWECALLINNFCFGISNLAFDVLLRGVYDKLNSKSSETKEQAQNEENVLFNGPIYSRIYSLQAHINKISTMSLGEFSLIAIFITIYLNKNTTFFDFCRNNITMFANADKHCSIKLIASILLRHMCQMTHNASALLDKSLKYFYMNELRPTFIFSYVAPSISMMNHSCANNTNCFAHGNKVFVKALRDIKKGEEITNNYNASYLYTNIAQRRQTLKNQYHFVCHCTACENPKLINKEKILDSFCCLECLVGKMYYESDDEDCEGKNSKFSCLDCKYSISLKKVGKMAKMKDSNSCASFYSAFIVDYEKHSRDTRLKEIKALLNFTNYLHPKGYQRIMRTYNDLVDACICLAYDKEIVDYSKKILMASYKLYGKQDFRNYEWLYLFARAHFQILDYILKEEIYPNIKYIEFVLGLLIKTKNELTKFFDDWDVRVKFIDNHISLVNKVKAYYRNHLTY